MWSGAVDIFEYTAKEKGLGKRHANQCAPMRIHFPKPSSKLLILLD